MIRSLRIAFLILSFSFVRAQIDSTSVRSVGLQFQPVISGVQDVFIAGTFNGWKPDQHRMLDKDGDGKFEIVLYLPEGQYLYKFVVDGQWLSDPEAAEHEPDGQGGQNAVLIVDESYSGVPFQKGDGSIYTDDLELHHDYSQINPMENGIVFSCRIHHSDVETVSVCIRDSTKEAVIAMEPAGSDERLDYYQCFVERDPKVVFQYYFIIKDGMQARYGTNCGWLSTLPECQDNFEYSSDDLPIYRTPEWAKHGIFYQIFPERFCNGDPSNDPDFSESYYQGLTDLPSSGKSDDEYFHLIKNWNDISGLTHSPYRTDDRPDIYSFYGGDIQGVMDKLDYLEDLGITIIYFNPLNPGKSNHKYDPIDYLKIDPHFADETTFRQFVDRAHQKGIRIIVDMAFNHTGDGHFAFTDSRDKGPESEYWDWYEWHKWPLPPEGCKRPCDYYSCWWGYPLHPNLNFDYSRTDAEENSVRNISDADPNMDVVDYCLETARYWIGGLDIDGFRLDVPNEVPFWFWRMFRATVDSLKPDAFLIGEIWHNAMPWLGPHCFHATMNYKYFRDPVLNFFIHRRIDARRFGEQLFPGRYDYPWEAALVMMNLIGSHDTERMLTLAQGDIRRLKLAVLFQMTYVGIPQIYYGDEIGLEGGRDPDNRRTFPWNWEGSAFRTDIHNYCRNLIGLRKKHPSLSTGSFQALLAEDQKYVYLRVLEDETCLICINNGEDAVQLKLRELEKYQGHWVDLLSNRQLLSENGILQISLKAMSGTVLKFDRE